MDDFFRRSFEFKPDSFDEEKREVMLSFSSETEEVERWFGVEVLSHRQGAPDLRRLRSVGSLLFGHSDEIVGPIKKVQINEASGRGEALVGFDETPEGNKRMLQVKNKSLRGVSVDYRIRQMRELQPGEEYQLGSRIIKGRKDKPVMVAERWEPVEISLLPKPADIDVGVGRSLSRSLEGIEIIKPNKEDSKMGDENKNSVDLSQVRTLVQDTLKEELKKIVPDIVTQTQAAITESAKPKIAVSTETFRDLTTRAAAVSPNVMNSVTNLILEGKTEPEVLRFLNDEIVKGSDSHNANVNNNGDNQNRQNNNNTENVRSFKEVEDDVFFNSLKNPAPFTYMN